MDSEVKKRIIREECEKRRSDEEIEEDGGLRNLGFLDITSRMETNRILALRGSIKGTKTTYLRRR